MGNLLLYDLFNNPGSDFILFSFAPTNTLTEKLNRTKTDGAFSTDGHNNSEDSKQLGGTTKSVETTKSKSNNCEGKKPEIAADKKLEVQILKDKKLETNRCQSRK